VGDDGAEKSHPRIDREARTLTMMVGLSCREQHGQSELCPDCKAMLDYALERLAHCPFQEGKTTCAKCRVHCYKAAMRARVRAVMRYSGPRMTYRHPVLAMRHFIDGLRSETGGPQAKAAQPRG